MRGEQRATIMKSPENATRQFSSCGARGRSIGFDLYSDHHAEMKPRQRTKSNADQAHDAP